jgi:hypothetical protein
MRIISFVVLLFFVCSAVLFSEQIARDPFEKDLFLLQTNRQKGSSAMVIGLIGTALGVVAGSTFTTLFSLNAIDQNVNTIGNISSYVAVSLSGILAVIGFFTWHKNTGDYIDTLQLQFRYNNLITQ